MSLLVTTSFRLRGLVWNTLGRSAFRFWATKLFEPPKTRLLILFDTHTDLEIQDSRYLKSY
jgi:hypothetical protein